MRSALTIIAITGCQQPDPPQNYILEQDYWAAVVEATCHLATVCDDLTIEGSIEDCVRDGMPTERWLESLEPNIVCYDGHIAYQCVDEINSVESPCESYEDAWPTACESVYQSTTEVNSGTEEARCEIEED